MNKLFKSILGVFFVISFLSGSVGAEQMYPISEAKLIYKRTGSFSTTSAAFGGNLSGKVTMGKTYTVVFDMKGDAPITFVVVDVRGYNRSGNSVQLTGVGVGFGIKEPNRWETKALVVHTHDYHERVNLRLDYFDCNFWRKEGGGGNVTIQNMRLYEGIVQVAKREPRRVFESSKIKLDAQGRWYIKENGNWKYIMPRILSSHEAIQDMDRFATDMLAYGFNGHETENGSALNQSAARGMYVTPHINDPSTIYKMNDTAWDKTLFLWIDGEEGYGTDCDGYYSSIDECNTFQMKKFGEIRYPIIFLGGLGASQTMDMYGKVDGYACYSDNDYWYVNSETTPTLSMMLDQYCDAPFAISQINLFWPGNRLGDTQTDDFTTRRLVVRTMDGLAAGSGGIALWKIGMSSSSSVEHYRDLPVFKDGYFTKLWEDVDKNIEIFQYPWYTKFQATINEVSVEHKGWTKAYTRFGNGAGYVIVTNKSSKPATINISLHSLPYNAEFAYDCVDSTFTDIADSSFETIIPELGYRIFKIQTTPSINDLRSSRIISNNQTNKVAVYDISGKLIKILNKGENVKKYLNVSQFAPGPFIIRDSHSKSAKIFIKTGN